MKNKHYAQKFNSTLSCIVKCLRFLSMIHKKLFFGLFILGTLTACGGPTAMIGPAYTFTSTGNLAQAGLTYGSNHIITKHTGKTTIENLQDISNLKEKSIQTQTLESEDFYIMVKNKIEKTSKILNLSN